MRDPIIVTYPVTTREFPWAVAVASIGGYRTWAAFHTKAEANRHARYLADELEWDTKVFDERRTQTNPSFIEEEEEEVEEIFDNPSYRGYYIYPDLARREWFIIKGHFHIATADSEKEAQEIVDDEIELHMTDTAPTFDDD